MWSQLPTAPLDDAVQCAARAAADAHLAKVDLTARECCEAPGRPFVPAAVRAVEQQLAKSNLDKEFLPIDGDVTFRRTVVEALLGPTAAAVQEKRVASCQGLSGTGCLRLMAEFYRKWTPQGADTPVYLSQPCPPCHRNVFSAAGFRHIHHYRYETSNGTAVDFLGLKADLQAAPLGAVVVLQAAAHEPCGVDPTLEQWAEIVQIAREKRFVLLFDLPGHAPYASHPDAEAAVLQRFERKGVRFAAAQSFSRSMGLYAERVGCLLVVTDSPAEAVSVNGQLKAIVRPMYSNPPSHAARIVTTLLNDVAVQAQWATQLATMAQHVAARRVALSTALRQADVPGDWARVERQNGIFAALGLSEAQCRALEDAHHVYLLPGAVLNLTALPEGREGAVAAALKAVL